MTDWSIEKARLTYGMTDWGGGYFNIDQDGSAVALPNGIETEGIKLDHLARELSANGLGLPVLVRFPEILQDRVTRMAEAFRQAMTENHYAGEFQAIYPIKVNQQRSVVEGILAHPRQAVGLEAGSKPELLAVLALSRSDGVIICNGYKDAEYIRLALIGQQMGHRVCLVIEKLSELDRILAQAEAMGVKPWLGVRVRLASLGKGNWQNTGGAKAKFGLSTHALLELVRRLEQRGYLSCLGMLHFHMGSQIANIRDIQHGMTEGARFFVELRNLGADIRWVDVGGGLGVDYEGSRSRNLCSINYSLDEYARNVVHTLADVCRRHQLPQPHILTESGRAMSAHHAVLITEVIDQEVSPGREAPVRPATQDSKTLHELWRIQQQLGQQPLLESYHDASYYMDEAKKMYNLGLLSLEQRADTEQLFYHICWQLRDRVNSGNRAHGKVLDELNELLAVKFFCNFSIFQSVPDVWGIEQIFPIMPLQRLDQAPGQHAKLQDLTCDSDGCIEHYVDHDRIESTLAVHDLTHDQPYYLGIFLVGAYQEILGDMHNLFGDTHSVNVSVDAKGQVQWSQVEHGDLVEDVLRYVHIEPEELLALYREKLYQCELNEQQKTLFLDELNEGLRGYTYLEH